MWLIRRILVILVILAVIATSTILIARANPAPDRLAGLGFGVCDGEPCFRGIKVGMDWREAARPRSEARESGSQITFGFGGIDAYVTVRVSPSRDKKTVSSITLEADLASSPPTVADLVQYLGYPCAAKLESMSWITLSSPGVETLIWQPNLRLELNSPIRRLTLREPEMSMSCSTPNNGLFPWYGFASADVYSARYQRAIGTAR